MKYLYPPSVISTEAQRSGENIQKVVAFFAKYPLAPYQGVELCLAPLSLLGEG